MIDGMIVEKLFLFLAEHVADNGRFPFNQAGFGSNEGLLVKINKIEVA